MSKLDRQEVDNAVNQAAKEIGTRFDFRGAGASIAWSGEHAIDIRANGEERAKAVLDVFKDKLVRRGVSLKTLDPGDPKLSGKEYRMSVALKEGITQDDAKKISKIIRDEGPKGVRAQVQGEELRVSAKKKDDLQVGHLAAEGQGVRLRPAVRQLPVTGPPVSGAGTGHGSAAVAGQGFQAADPLACGRVGEEQPGDALGR